METRQWTLASKPSSLPTLTGPNPTFTLTTTTLPALQPSQLLLKPIYFSNDPGLRPWISANANPARSYLPPIHEGEPMRAFAIAQVLQSTTPSIPPETLVSAFVDWSELSIRDASECQVLTPVPGLSISHFLGALGMTAITAYYGLKEVAKVQAGETVVVSGAAGATGAMAVQIASKLFGCRVIGIAGTPDKCSLVKRLGADECVNYRSDSFEEDLIRATEGDVDAYFGIPLFASLYRLKADDIDNVGGSILDLLLTRMKRFGRIAACGIISSYNSPGQYFNNFFEIIQNRINIQGFFALDYIPHIPATTELLIQAWTDGKIVIDEDMETVVEAKFEDVPGVWLRLFEGSNTGKLCTKVVD